MPDKDGLYLCCGATIDWSMNEDKPDAIFTAWYRSEMANKWHERTGPYEDVLVTHWMPLPGAPNE
jgi:hypothetical protein